MDFVDEKYVEEDDIFDRCDCCEVDEFYRCIRRIQEDIDNYLDVFFISVDLDVERRVLKCQL